MTAKKRWILSLRQECSKNSGDLLGFLVIVVLARVVQSSSFAGEVGGAGVSMVDGLVLSFMGLARGGLND